MLHSLSQVHIWSKNRALFKSIKSLSKSCVRLRRLFPSRSQWYAPGAGSRCATASSYWLQAGCGIALASAAASVSVNCRQSPRCTGETGTSTASRTTAGQDHSAACPRHVYRSLIEPVLSFCHVGQHVWRRSVCSLLPANPSHCPGHEVRGSDLSSSLLLLPGQLKVHLHRKTVTLSYQ